MNHQPISHPTVKLSWTIKPWERYETGTTWWCLYRGEKHIACFEDQNFAWEVRYLFEEEPYSPLAALRAYRKKQWENQQIGK